MERTATERKIKEIQRELDRITAELGGQPSVIRRTKLKKSLVDSQNKLLASFRNGRSSKLISAINDKIRRS